ncbi:MULTISPECIES: TetR family transcriptional regulator [unclassified Nocardioides]|uniref:TetR family transcriptional regulator n=1 Tax=unclassified Nocardioides TaxID=2615069 RepID=UPI0006F98297|nr:MULTISPECIES: TetR family transcriptional regulator [unclassified Nocardioides]KRA29929.1 hypothetical protein ASD81_19710 [Nocardioides sp. Root614]KRA86850.1 hypothetical protein ASD84_21925 [Nocardioides sp. Root682]
MRRASAARRDAIFTALRDLLLAKPWGDITLEAVASDAGVSRQTLYNSFGSRYGLAQAYTLALADALCDLIAATLEEHRDDRRAGLEAGLRTYLEVAATDPLIQRVRAGDAHPDLVQLVTADSATLLTHVGTRLEAALRTSWPDVDATQRRTLARTVARLAVSFVPLPPEYDDSPAAIATGLSSLLAPH